MHSADGTHPRGEHEVRPYGSRWVFGSVRDGRVRLTLAGKMVAAVWTNLPRRFDHLRLDAFVVMPDHFHALLWIEPVLPWTGIGHGGPTHGPAHGSLGQIIQAFKSETTHRYVISVRAEGWPPFRRRLWQRNYYERIIRTPAGLLSVRRYIDLNPVRWRAG
jgi:putative transposase